LRQTLQGYCTSGGVADEALELIATMGRNMGIGVQGKAVYAGTTRTAQGGGLAFGAKARANPPDSLTGTLTKGNALLHRGRQGSG
jgi:hypothetical protein